MIGKNRRLFSTCLWIFLVFSLFPLSQAHGDLSGQLTFDLKTHCWVIEPPGLASDAPVVFLLHGLGGRAERFKTGWEGLSLPPCRYVVPNAPIPYDPFRHSFTNWLRQTVERFFPRSINPLGYAW